MAKYTPSEKIIDVSTVFGKGKTQIPIKVRKLLNIEDGDNIIWVTVGAEISVRKA